MDSTCKCLLILLLFGFPSTTIPRSQTRVYHFSTPVTFQTDTMRPVTQHIITTESKLECAVLCTESDFCNTFAYTEQDGRCQISSDVVSGTVDVYGYNKGCPIIGCPTDMDYTFYASEKVCLRHDNREVTQPEAVDLCRAEGAHLVLIENHAMYLFLTNLMADINSDSVFIDGVDIGENGTFFSWRGTQVPYLVFGDGDPDGPPETCLRLSYSNGYVLKDEVCSANKQFFCQF